MIDSVAYALAKSLVLPPGLQVLGGALGLLCLLRWRRLGILLIAASTLSLWLLATPWFAATLARGVETHTAVEPAEIMSRAPQAIVVLGGGSYRRAPEFGGFDEINALTLERLRYAARLQRATGLELAVTGGTTYGMSTPEAVRMAVTLSADFRVPVRWLETQSRTTDENARFSAATFPFRDIVLVTHALHMPRAERAFVAAGFSVLPAPLGFVAADPASDADAEAWVANDFLPDMKSFWQAHYVLYELIGAVWYRYF